MIRALPGDPIEALIGESSRDISKEELSYLRKEYGLDDPIYVQYSRWLSGWLGKGELGLSYQDERPVLEVILERLPATILLVGSAMAISFTAGTSWGLFLIYLKQRYRALESFVLSITLIAYALPAFLVGLCAIYLATYVQALHFIPVFAITNQAASPIGVLISLTPFVILPSLCLSVGRGAKIALYIRTLALDEINKNYVVMAIAKGLPNSQVLFKHVCINCLLPVVNLLALSLPSVIGGSVLIETIFGWPGIGRLAVDATFGRNYPVMTCLVMLYGSMVIFSNLLADLIGPLIDPRQRDDLALLKGDEAMRSAQL